jgi:mutator protein MutT
MNPIKQLPHKLIAIALIVNNEGRILCLTRRTNTIHRPGEWDFPGGKLKPDELPAKAVVRETFEETGLSIQDPKFICATTDASKNDVVTLLFFSAHAPSKPQVSLSEEHVAYEWLTLKALQAKPDFPPFHKAISMAARLLL